MSQPESCKHTLSATRPLIPPSSLLRFERVNISCNLLIPQNTAFCIKHKSTSRGDSQQNGVFKWASAALLALAIYQYRSLPYSHSRPGCCRSLFIFIARLQLLKCNNSNFLPPDFRTYLCYLIAKMTSPELVAVRS